MRAVLGTVGGSLLAIASSGTAHAETWAKTYVIEWYEAALYYGAEDGTIEPGTDCPAGAAAAPDWHEVMVKAGYSAEESEWLRDPANPTRSPINGQPMMAFRGADRQNVYDYPTTIAEAGLPPVTGTIGLGLDLDGDPTNGFTSPDGETGIDNAYYKALGCWKSVRGPARLSDGAKGSNDSMREGAWTVVIVLSGDGADPRNDDNVKVGFYTSSDAIVRDGAGGVATDYTFSIKPDDKLETILEGRSRDGVITAKADAPVWMRGPDARELKLVEAQLRLTMKEDGTLSGLMGGYRPWLPIYEGLVAARGPVVEALTWVQLPDIYYALRRYADYSPTGPDGEKTYISYNMQIDAAPAYVMTPDASRVVSAVETYELRNANDLQTAQLTTAGSARND